MGAAPPIEFTLLARDEDAEQLKQAVERCTSELTGYNGVHDVAAGGRPGKWEYRLKVRDAARMMGVSLSELSGAVRNPYYGEEVMRLQRGRNEVELRVRYPDHQRHSQVNSTTSASAPPAGPAGRSRSWRISKSSVATR